MTQTIRDRLKFVVICVSVSALLLVTPSSNWAQAIQRPGVRRLRENATLPIDSTLPKRFGTAIDLLSDQRWNEAMGILQEITQTDHKGLVLVQPGMAGGFQTYLNVATRCNILFSQVSPEGIQRYRQKIDPQAKRWYENWLRTRDDTDLLKIVRQAFLSSYGDEALLSLGESAWDRGDFSTARLWWEQLIPLPPDAQPVDYPTVLKYPDAEIDQPSILARIVLCSILEREHIRAEFSIRKFATDFPTAVGWLAGQRGRLAEILQQKFDESRSWPVSKPSAEVETFASSPTRTRVIPESIDVGSLRWAHQLITKRLPPPEESIPFQNEPLSYNPVVYEKIVLVNDADSIRAWNVFTGEPAWPSEREDAAVIYPSVSEEASAIPDKKCVGVPEFTMTISDDRLYARMGSPVSSTTNLPQRDLESDLVCLDLIQQGKLLWKIPARNLLNDGSWRFEGTPVVVSGRAYVAMCRRRPQLELVVVCLDSSDGRLLWQQPIGGFRASVDDHFNRVSHLLLTAGGGRVFLTTDVGVIVGLDARDGRLEWAISYESRTNDTPAALSDPQQKGLKPAIFFNGWLIAAPNDSDFAYCIEADSGRVRWRFPYLSASQDVPELMRREREAEQRRENQWRYLLGVTPEGFAGRLFVSGKSLAAIDLETGKKIWQTPRTAFGRGLLAGDQVLVPGRATIDICSQQTGEVLRTIPLKTSDTGQQGGNLTLANGMLFVAQPNRLAAYSEFSQLKERLEKELTLHPGNSSLRLQLGELEAAGGERSAAETAFRYVLEQSPQNDPNSAVARQKLAELRYDAAKSCIENGRIEDAVDLWQRSLFLTDDLVRRTEILFRLARADETLNRPEVALKCLQSVLDDERLASLPQGALTAGRNAAGQMSRIISEHGPEFYAGIEVTATQECEELDLNASSTELRQFIRKYPHSQAVERIRERLADWYRCSGLRSKAYAVLNTLRENTSNDADFVQTTVAMIELLDEIHGPNGDSYLWKQLTSYAPTINVTYAGHDQTLGNLLASRSNSFQPDSQASPLNVERTWAYLLSTGNSVVFPENSPTSSKQACVLVCAENHRQPNAWSWQCLDWQSGKIRWEVAATCAMKIARWSPVHLLIGTSNGWQARDPESGLVIWEQVVRETSVPLFALQSTGEGDDHAWPTLFNPERGIQLFDPNDGELASRLKPPGQMHDRIAIGSALNVGVVLRDVSITSENSPSSHNPHPKRPVIDQSMVALFQTIKPARVWLATAQSARSSWAVQEISTGDELWRGTPFVLENHIIDISYDQQLVGCNLLNKQTESSKTLSESPIPDQDMHSEIVEFLRSANKPGEILTLDDISQQILLRRHNVKADFVRNEKERKANHWMYRNFSFGHSHPFAWPQMGALIALSDGSRLMSFAAVNGERKWTVGLADYPLRSPPEQICSLNQMVFATSQGKLRCINIQNGNVQFERYLGDAAAQWQTSIAWNEFRTSDSELTGKDQIGHERAVLAVWPLAVSDTLSSLVWLCDAEKGEVLQRIRVDSQPRKLVFNHEGTGVVWTAKSISGLRDMTFTARGQE